VIESRSNFVRRMNLLLALFGLSSLSDLSPLFGLKRT
jgi:hypothetical protein